MIKDDSKETSLSSADLEMQLKAKEEMLAMEQQKEEMLQEDKLAMLEVSRETSRIQAMMAQLLTGAKGRMVMTRRFLNQERIRGRSHYGRHTINCENRIRH